jgi:ppGpp synthetase/RelA/SpoT-type nucleotidyltranferase
MTDLQSLRSSYDTTRPVADHFAQRLAEQLAELLSANQISLAVPIEHRVKAWDSIRDKVERQSLKITNVAELNDFVGLRVILLFLRDVERVSELLSSSLQVDSSEDTTERLGVSEFGYQSVHMQLSLPDAWLHIPTFNSFGGLKAEMQVRTTAQHIWAAASHILQYKRESAVPGPVRRSINRVAALLETVDLEFERALGEREEYSESADIQQDDAALNADLVRRVLNDELTADRLSADDPYGELLQELLDKSIRTTGELRRFIKDNIDEALREDKAIVEKVRSHGIMKDGKLVVKDDDGTIHSDPDFINRGVFKSQVGLIRQMMYRHLSGPSGKTDKENG